MTFELADFAARHHIAPAVAYVLPALFERTGEKVGMTARALLAEANRNAKLGAYLAECAHKVAIADGGMR